jgi:hypothetical protein
MSQSISKSKLNAALQKLRGRTGVRQTAQLIADAINLAAVNDSDVVFTDITTGNVSITKHGFAPKAPNDATKFLDGTGAYSVPAYPASTWDAVAVITAANFTTTNLTATDITGLTFNTAINSVYEIDCLLLVQSSTTAGLKVTAHHTGAGATLSAVGGNTLPGTGIYGLSLDTLSGAIITTAATDGTIWMRGHISTGANAGTFSIQVAKVTSGTATVKKGSVLKSIKRV